MKTKSIFASILLLLLIFSAAFFGFNNPSTSGKACVGFGVLLNSSSDADATVYVRNVSTGYTFYLTGGYGGNPFMFYGCPQQYGVYNVIACQPLMHGYAYNINFQSPSGAYVEINMQSGACRDDEQDK